MSDYASLVQMSNIEQGHKPRCGWAAGADCDCDPEALAEDLRLQEEDLRRRRQEVMGERDAVEAEEAFEESVREVEIKEDIPF